MPQVPKKKKRAYIFWVFIFFAFPLAVGILGYAAGYRIDRKTQSIVKTSALSIYSTPHKATVSINGIEHEETTPFISTFQPGTYAVRVSKDGYFSWETTATLDERTSALFPHVTLFPQASLSIAEEMPEKKSTFTTLTDSETIAASTMALFSPTDTMRAVRGSGTLLIDDTKKQYAVFDTSFNTLLHSGEGHVVAAEWLDRSLLIATDTEIHIFNLNTREITLVTRQTTPIVDAAFLPAGTHIVFIDANGLYVIESYEYNIHARTTLSEEHGMSNLVITKNPDTAYVRIGTKVFSLPLE